MYISNNPEIARLIASFHRDSPKSARTLPKWDLNIVLDQLTKAPFEPLTEASLKLVTLKMVFLLALDSWKIRSEIHAWTLKGLLCLGDWDQVQPSPSPSFLAKNQVAKEGANSVLLVIIPSLQPTDYTTDQNILLCPVRALKIYLD